MEKYGPRLAPPHPLPARLPSGHAVECDLRDHVQRHIYFQGVYEPIEAYLWRPKTRSETLALDTI